jgi:hypothetical protein
MKRTALRKRGAGEYSRAHARAWKAFADYIRHRDPWCYTCRTRETTDAGHFLHNRLDFDEINVHGQCARCNRYLHGNPDAYEMRLREDYGDKVINALIYRAQQIQKYTIAELDEITKEYRELNRRNL